MNVVYSSPQYYVLEYPPQNGYEIVNRIAGRGTFIKGELASRFWESIQQSISENPTSEHVDEVISNYDSLMTQRVTLH